MLAIIAPPTFKTLEPLELWSIEVGKNFSWYQTYYPFIFWYLIVIENNEYFIWNKLWIVNWPDRLSSHSLNILVNSIQIHWITSYAFLQFQIFYICVFFFFLVSIHKFNHYNYCANFRNWIWTIFKLTIILSRYNRLFSFVLIRLIKLTI